MGTVSLFELQENATLTNHEVKTGHFRYREGSYSSENTLPIYIENVARTKLVWYGVAVRSEI